MDKRQSRPTRWGRAWRSATVLGVLIAGCGGGTGTDRDSGPNKTYLQVAASDADADIACVNRVRNSTFCASVSAS